MSKTPEHIAEGQREWQRKWESGEFTAEANAAKLKLEQAAPDLLAACKMVQEQILGHMEGAWPGTMSITAKRVADVLRAAIAKAE